MKDQKNRLNQTMIALPIMIYLKAYIFMVITAVLLSFLFSSCDESEANPLKHMDTNQTDKLQNFNLEKFYYHTSYNSRSIGFCMQMQARMVKRLSLR